MGPLALLVAAAATAAIAVPSVGKLAAIGLGLSAVVAGAVAYRRREARGSGRLAGAAGIALGSLALLLGTAKVTLTFVAIEHLAQVFR